MKVDGVKFNHLRGKRRRGNNKNKLQVSTRGYWTKNFLQFGKKAHLDYLRDKNGNKYMREHALLVKLVEKKAIIMNDYV